MKVQDFLDISDYNKYLIINNKNESISEVIDKYNAMKICGLDELIKVSSKLELVDNRIEVICILQV